MKQQEYPEFGSVAYMLRHFRKAVLCEVLKMAIVHICTDHLSLYASNSDCDEVSVEPSALLELEDDLLC